CSCSPPCSSSLRPPPSPPLLPYTTLFRSIAQPIGRYLARLLAEERAARGTRRGRRALSVWGQAVLVLRWFRDATPVARLAADARSEEHTSELQSRENLVCRLLLEKKKTNK